MCGYGVYDGRTFMGMQSVMSYHGTEPITFEDAEYVLVYAFIHTYKYHRFTSWSMDS